MSKTRSELREGAVKVLYETYILDKAKVTYDIKNLIREELGMESAFTYSLVEGVIKYQKNIKFVYIVFVKMKVNSQIELWTH